MKLGDLTGERSEAPRRHKSVMRSGFELSFCWHQSCPISSAFYQTLFSSFPNLSSLAHRYYPESWVQMGANGFYCEIEEKRSSCFSMPVGMMMDWFWRVVLLFH